MKGLKLLLLIVIIVLSAVTLWRVEVCACKKEPYLTQSCEDCRKQNNCPPGPCDACKDWLTCTPKESYSNAVKMCADKFCPGCGTNPNSDPSCGVCVDVYNESKILDCCNATCTDPATAPGCKYDCGQQIIDYPNS